MKTCVVFFLCMLASFCCALDEDGWIFVGRCRAYCTTKYLKAPPTDSACDDSPNCNLCWDVCEKIVKERSTKRYLCGATDKNICPGGCETACRAVNKIKRSLSATGVSWIFTSDPEVTDLDQNVVQFEWTPPVPWGSLSLADSETHVVYNLMWKNSRDIDWLQLSMSIDPEVTARPHFDHNLADLDFKLVAITIKGVVAETNPIYEPNGIDMNDAPRVADTWKYFRSLAVESSTEEEKSEEVIEQAPAHEFEIKAVEEDPELDVDLAFNVRVHVQDDGLVARATWRKTMVYNIQYCTLWWGRESCQVDENFEGCPHAFPNYHYAVDISMEENENPLYKLTQITYNSKYWMSIECPGIVPQSVYFVTPPCPNPDTTLTKCDAVTPHGGVKQEETVKSVRVLSDKLLIIISVSAGILLVFWLACTWFICKGCRKNQHKEKIGFYKGELNSMADLNLLNARTHSNLLPQTQHLGLSHLSLGSSNRFLNHIHPQSKCSPGVSQKILNSDIMSERQFNLDHSGIEDNMEPERHFAPGRIPPLVFINPDSCCESDMEDVKTSWAHHYDH